MISERLISCNDPDVESAKVTWYDDDAVFVEQVETGGYVRHHCLFSKAAAQPVVSFTRSKWEGQRRLGAPAL